MHPGESLAILEGETGVGRVGIDRAVGGGVGPRDLDVL